MCTDLQRLIIIITGACLLCACSTYRSTVDTTSLDDLAALYDATNGRDVTVFYSDSSTQHVIRKEVKNLHVDVHQTSWTNGTTDTQTIRTSQIVRVSCDACVRRNVSGLLIGSVIGGASGLLIGVIANSEPTHSGGSGWDWWYRILNPPPDVDVVDKSSSVNITPVTFGLGLALGAALGYQSLRGGIWDLVKNVPEGQK